MEINPRTQRIECIDRIRTAYIMYKDIAIATISEEYASISGAFDWIIKPNYENIELCKTKYNHYVDIPGIDIRLGKEEYIRTYEPCFISQRVPPEGREDLFPLLKKIGLRYRDCYEIMCRTHSVCGNNRYYVSRTSDDVIDVNAFRFEYNIPDWDTDEDGWLYSN